MRRGIYFIGLLLLLLSCTDERQAKDVRMQELLKLVEEENRLEKRLPSDTVFQEVVNYYDDYGNANQRMKAHYLMGCIYRDMHETPMALQYLLNAAELADTLASALEMDNEVVVAGLGNFEAKHKKERVMVNPSTGKKMLVPPKVVINFKMSRAPR